MKKICSLLLAMGLAAGPACTAAAELPAEITGVEDDFGTRGYLINGESKPDRRDVMEFAHLTHMAPGTELFLPLTYEDFTWEDDKIWPVNARTAEELGIELWYDIVRGSAEIKTIALCEKYGKFGLLVEFSPLLYSLDEEDFDIEAAIQVDGTRYPGASFRIRGSVENRLVSATRGTKRLELGPGRMARAYADVKGVSLEVGAGLTLTADLEFAQMFYGAARRGADPEIDGPALALHPSIREVYTLDTINLNGKVTFDVKPGELFYVYDQQLGYLGTTARPLPREPKYYLSAEKF